MCEMTLRAAKAAITAPALEMIMTSFSKAISTGNPAVGALSRRIGAALKRWWLAYMDWRLQQMAINRLRFMSDRELRDIGLCRPQIEFAVRGKTERHPFFTGCGY
jgi:uncharacterized protein YjiS (DUF1127 family)